MMDELSKHMMMMMMMMMMHCNFKMCTNGHRF